MKIKQEFYKDKNKIKKGILMKLIGIKTNNCFWCLTILKERNIFIVN